MKKSVFLLALLPLVALPQSIRSEVIFHDGFETADMSATNADGFAWNKNNRTSVVTQHQNDGPVAVYNNRAIYNPHSSTMPDGVTRDWTAFGGDHSLRFRYAALGNWAEQKFDLGTPQTDLWISFMLKVPPNFKHDPAINNKLLAIWMDGYIQNGEGTTLLIQYWPDGDGGSYLHWQRSSDRDTVNTVRKYEGFLRYPEDQGRWMQLVVHVKASSSNTIGDGEIGVWRRWEEASEFSKLADWTGKIPLPSGGPRGWKAGYLMGWTNKGFAVETEWLVDDFMLSTSSLVLGAENP